MSTLELKVDLSKIKRETRFICGPRFNPNGLENQEFKYLENKLIELGYEVFNPLSYPECEDTRVENACMAMCDKVVTINGWDVDQKCYNQVKVARILLKEVIPSDRYFFNDNFISTR